MILKKVSSSLILIVPLLLLLSQIIPTQVSAFKIDDMKNYANGTVAGSLISSKPFAELAGFIFFGLAGTIGLLFVFFMVYAGYLWFFAPLKEENIVKAKDIIKWAIWGMVFIIISYAIVTFLFGAFK